MLGPPSSSSSCKRTPEGRLKTNLDVHPALLSARHPCLSATLVSEGNLTAIDDRRRVDGSALAGRWSDLTRPEYKRVFENDLLTANSAFVYPVLGYDPRSPETGYVDLPAARLPVRFVLPSPLEVSASREESKSPSDSSELTTAKDFAALIDAQRRLSPRATARWRATPLAAWLASDAARTWRADQGWRVSQRLGHPLDLVKALLIMKAPFLGEEERTLEELARVWAARERAEPTAFVAAARTAAGPTRRAASEMESLLTRALRAERETRRDCGDDEMYDE